MPERVGPSKAYWGEVGALSKAILEGTPIKSRGRLLQMQRRTVDWDDTPNFHTALLTESRYRFLGSVTVDRAFSGFNLGGELESGEELWIGKTFEFDPDKELLRVRTGSLVRDSLPTLREKITKVRRQAEEDRHGLSVPEDQDYEILREELRYGFLEQSPT